MPRKTKSNAKPGSYIRQPGTCRYCGASKQSIKQHEMVCSRRRVDAVGRVQQAQAPKMPLPVESAAELRPIDAGAPDAHSRYLELAGSEREAPTSEASELDYNPMPDVVGEPSPAPSSDDLEGLRGLAGDRPAGPSEASVFVDVDDKMTLDEWLQMFDAGLAKPAEALDPMHLFGPDFSDEVDRGLFVGFYRLAEVYKPAMLSRSYWQGGDRVLTVFSVVLLASAYALKRVKKIQDMKREIGARRAQAQAPAGGVPAQERPATGPGVV